MPYVQRLTIVGLTVAASIGAAAPSLAAHRSATHVVKAQNIKFTPSRLTIHRGDRVTWHFLDAAILAPHTVTSEGPLRFKDMRNPKASGTFTVTFTKPGTYRYMCTIHPASMNGVITVR